MSRWLPDRLQITLAPETLIVARSAHRLDLRAARSAPLPTHVIPVAAGDRDLPAWSGALAALGEVVGNLDAHGLTNASATVVLANRFARYALVPWSQLIDDEDETEALALSRHYLREIYGAAADGWELRIAPERQGTQKLVSAVEPELLTELRQVFAGTTIRLTSIQPRLMTVCNRHGNRLGHGDAWLALVEPGSLWLALLQQGRIARLRHVRLGESWPDDLTTALERERYLTDSAVATHDVFLAAAGMKARPFPPGPSWVIRLLEPIELTTAAPPELVGSSVATGG